MDSKILILIVEDDKPIKRFLEVSIETQGYKYISSETGQEAMALAFSYNPEVILLDLGLPDIDGIDLISKIKENLE